MLAGAERQASVVGSRILLTGIYSIPDLVSAASPAPCSDAFGLAIKHLMFGASLLRLVRISNQMLLFYLILSNTTTVCWSCCFCHPTVANCHRNTNKSHTMLLAPAIMWKKTKVLLSWAWYLFILCYNSCPTGRHTGVFGLVERERSTSAWQNYLASFG